MGGDAYGATIAKKRLADFFGALRLDRGLTATQICERLGWGRGKLGRFELNQWKRPEMSDMRDLLRLYQIEGEQYDRIMSLALLARERAWWRDFADVFDSEYPGFENDASTIRCFFPLTIPELLQTKKYAAQRHPRSARQVESILYRQRILLRPAATAPRLTAVITEAALRYDWGNVGDQLEQVVRLVELGRRPNVELRLHAFHGGSPPGPVLPVTQMRFPPDDGDDLVFVDTGVALSHIASQPESVTYMTHLEEVLQQALDHVRTLDYLSDLAGVIMRAGETRELGLH
ncbi:helix-turn-helix domain-containing protein [Herbidospora mongoliensis]|uniref:helix-turn-helix domain-containing protein n=1 Tax=Herbidospora mongoliensis TaxID=688067 RepID=UPI0008297166|nr:helix-turn-helix transcriptional regulator [Herbidospora mongoliensis]